MRILTFTALLFVSSATSAEIFKCVAPNGELMFMDRPCPEETTQEVVEVQRAGEVDWLNMINAKKPDTILITSVEEKEDEVLISYEFSNTEVSTEFMQTVNDLSSITTRLLDFVAPSETQVGKAKIRVSDKPLPTSEDDVTDQ